MATMLTVSLTVHQADRHEELNTLAGVLQDIVDRLDTNHALYAGAHSSETITHLLAGDVGSWTLTHLPEKEP